MIGYGVHEFAHWATYMPVTEPVHQDEMEGKQVPRETRREPNLKLLLAVYSLYRLCRSMV